VQAFKGKKQLATAGNHLEVIYQGVEHCFWLPARQLLDLAHIHLHPLQQSAAGFSLIFAPLVGRDDSIAARYNLQDAPPYL
jgi:hypothetical protein